METDVFFEEPAAGQNKAIESVKTKDPEAEMKEDAVDNPDKTVIVANMMEEGQI